MARRPGEFRWTILPTVASYYVYRFEKKSGRNLKLRKEVQERFGMPLSGSEMKVDRNLKEAYEIEFGDFSGKKGSNHHDRYIIRNFEKYPLDKIEELYYQIIHECLSLDNMVILKDHAVKVLRSAPMQREVYIASTIEHGLDIRDKISEINKDSSFLKEKVLFDGNDTDYVGSVNESSGRKVLSESEIDSLLDIIPEPVKVNANIRWPRDKSIAWTALERANHLCELNSEHLTFPRVNEKVNYVEPHHLVPISKQAEFNINLDNIYNIIALCPNCHRAIHVADQESRRDFIRRSFLLRKEKLKSIGLEISEKFLFKLYNL